MIRLGPKTSVYEMNVTVVSTVTGCDVTDDSRDALQRRPRVQKEIQGSECLGAQYGPPLLSLSSQESCSSRSELFLLVGTWVPQYQELGSIQEILRFLIRVPGGMGRLYPFFLVDLLEAVPTRNPKRFQVVNTIWPSFVNKDCAVNVSICVHKLSLTTRQFSETTLNQFRQIRAALVNCATRRRKKKIAHTSRCNS